MPQPKSTTRSVPSGRNEGTTSSTSSRKRFDLPELVVAALAHRAVGVITPSSTRNGTGVPSSSRYRFFRSCSRGAALLRRRPAEHGLPEHLPVRLRGLKQPLPVVGEQRAEALARGVGSEVLVCRPVGEMRGEAIRRLAAQLHGIDRRLRRNLGRARLREHRAAQLVAREEIGQELVERSGQLRALPPRGASARSRSASGRTERHGRAGRAGLRRRRRSSPHAATRRPRPR